MGIYDREYYRGDSRNSAFLSNAPVTTGIIIANVAVFVFERLNIIDRNVLFNGFAASSDAIFHHGYIWQLLSAAFLHANLMHLIGNMYVLWIFGRELEAMYGERDFLALYLSAAVVSTLGWAAVDASQPEHFPMIGASGAVLAVSVLYACFYPRRELLLMFVIPVEVWLLVTLFIAYDAYTLLSGTETRTAVVAHLAGGAYGYLFKHFDLRLSRLRHLWTRFRRPRLRIVPVDPLPREKPTSRPPSGTNPGPTWAANSASVSKPASTAAIVPEEQLDARLDEVLAKIARDGRSSLTDDENRILQEASRRAQNRRSDRL